MLRTRTPESEASCSETHFSTRWTDLVRLQDFHRAKLIGESGDVLDAEIKAYEHLRVLLEELGGDQFRIAVEQEVERKNGVLMRGEDGNPQAEYPKAFDTILGGCESKAEYDSRKFKFNALCQFVFCRKYLDLDGTDRRQRICATALVKYGI